MSKGRVVVGMSGGVDSSVAALLLKEQGYEVVGIFMQNWEDDNDDKYCSIKQDFLDVVSVADRIGVDVELVNFAQMYKTRVFEIFLQEYQAGRTPNPDVLCNSEIKFNAFLAHALQLGADFIATGHYAQLRTFNGSRQLLKARDGTKDQSYFLYRLSQAQLQNALFPLGDLYKRQVRAIAQAAGLSTAHKKDSTGICFIGERPFREFLQRYLPKQPGAMKTPEGKIVGQHQGLMYYTLGQRQGLGIGGQGDAWFVAEKNMADNTLIVVQGHDHPRLLSQTLHASQANWIAGSPPACAHVLTAKTRYRQHDAPCTLTMASHQTCTVGFAQAQWAVTPGQSVVLYEGQVCLGGGIIDSSTPPA